MKIVSKSGEYVIASRRIAGTRAEKLAQIDAAMQELLDIRLLEFKTHAGDADLIARGEYRFDNSQGPEGGYFSGPDNLPVPHQHLLIDALVLAFDHVFPVSK